MKLLFREWLAEHYPDRAKHVMSLINQTQGGKDYDSTFGRRMSGSGAYAELLRSRFELARRKCGYDAEPDRLASPDRDPHNHDRHDLATHLFRPPVADQPQLTLGF